MIKKWLHFLLLLSAIDSSIAQVESPRNPWEGRVIQFTDSSEPVYSDDDMARYYQNDFHNWIRELKNVTVDSITVAGKACFKISQQGRDPVLWTGGQTSSLGLTAFQTASPWVLRLKMSEVDGAQVKVFAKGVLLGREQKLTPSTNYRSQDGYYNYSFSPLKAPVGRLQLTIPISGITLCDVKLTRAQRIVRFVEDIELSEDAVESELYIWGSGNLDIEVNGRSFDIAQGPVYTSKYVHRVPVNNLKKGRNRIVVSVSAGQLTKNILLPSKHSMLLEGYVRGEKSVKKIFSNSRWKAYSVASGLDGGRGQAVTAKKVSKLKGLGGAHRNLAFYSAPYLGSLYIRNQNQRFTFERKNSFGISVCAHSNAGKVQSVVWQKEKLFEKVRESELEIPARSCSKQNFNLPNGAYVLEWKDKEEGRSIFHEVAISGNVEPATHVFKSYQFDVDEERFEKFDLSLKRPDKKSIESYLKEKFLGRNDWKKTRIDHPDWGRPHILELELEILGQANIVTAIVEEQDNLALENLGPHAGVVKFANGIYREKDEKAVISLQHLFFPSRPSSELLLRNISTADSDFAIKRVSVRSAEPDDILPPPKDRKFGPFVERIDRTIPRYFFSGWNSAKTGYDMADGYYVGYYLDWYNAIDNLAYYLRWYGYNSYYAGVYMYNGGWIPNSRYSGQHRTGLKYLPANWDNQVVELLSNRLLDYGIDLYLAVQFMGSPWLIENSDKNLLNFQMVDKKGEVGRGLGGANFFNEQVRTEMLGLAKELGEKYGSYKGVKGIVWGRSPEYISDSQRGALPSETGYNKNITELFEEHCRDNLAAREASGQCREEWFSWRAESVNNFHQQLASILKQARPDWEYVAMISPFRRSDYLAYSEGRATIEELMRYKGWDKESSSVNYMLVDDIAEKVVSRDKVRQTKVAEAVSLMYSDPRYQQLERQLDLLIRGSFIMENRYYANKEFGWKRTYIITSSYPLVDEFIERYKAVYQQSAAKYVAVSWSDVGHQAPDRGFVRAIHEMMDK